MARMHSYYVSNSKTEIKYAYQELGEVEFRQAINETVFPFDDEDSDEDNENNEDNEVDFDNEDIDEEIATQINENKLPFENLIDLNDSKFREALEIEVSVIIPPPPEIEDEGNFEFNVHSIVTNRLLARRQNKE